MKTKLFALALAASMTAGVAFAQTAIETPTQSGGSEATPEATQRGVPELPGETIIGNFYSDPAMTKMRSDKEITTYWSGLTSQEQKAVRAGCTNAATAQTKDLPESTLNVCARVNAMK